MKKVVVLIVAISMLLSLFTPKLLSVNAAGFKDVTAAYWAKDQINYLVQNEIVAGYPDGTFKPEGKVTREDFVKMIVLAKGLKEYKPAVPTFTDVPTSRWSFGFVEAAVKAGYIKGIGGGKFGPGNNIKREDLAVLLCNVIGEGKEANDPKLVIATFSNDEGAISSYARGAVTIAVRPETQLLLWDKSTRDLRPNAFATRAECAYSTYMVMKPPQKGGTINIALWNEPTTLFYGLSGLGPMMDVLGGCGGQASGLNAIGLVGTTPEGVVYPYVASNIPSTKDGTWIIDKAKGTMITTWHIRKGATWSDGVPITSHDLVFSEKMMEDPKVASVSNCGSEYIDHVEAPDPYTFKVYWKKLNMAANDGAHLYPAHILEPIYNKDPSLINTCDYNYHPVYAGPYVLETWSRGNYLLFQRNPNYWAGAGLLQYVNFKVFPDTNTMLMNLLGGALDVTPLELGMDVKEAASATKGGLTNKFTEYVLPSTYFEHITLNLTDPVLKDKTLRQALMYALDRQELIKEIFLGQRVASNGTIPLGEPGAAKNLNPYSYNPAKAKAMLKTAGYTWDAQGELVNPSGTVVKITLSAPAGNVNRQQQISFIGQDWKTNLGIQVTYRPIIGTFTYLGNGDFQGIMWATFFSDPENAANTEYVTGNTATDKTMPNIPTAKNGYLGQDFARFNNAAFDKLADEYNSTMDHSARVPLSQKMEDIQNEELPDLYLTWYTVVGFVRKNVKGTDFGSTIGLTSTYTWNIDYWSLSK
jgi:peptide/nickel transport system substrate-binding protein